MKIKKVLTDFFKSQEFNELYHELSSIGKELYTFYRQYGFKGIWTHVWQLLDSENERQAFEVNQIRLDMQENYLFVLDS